MSFRINSCLAAICVAVLVQSSAGGTTWVNKQILLKNPMVWAGDLVQGKVVNTRKLERVDYTVLKERGSWIQVKDRATPCWLAKEDAVLLEKAKAHFTTTTRKEAAFRGSNADPDAWVRTQVDALVLYARAAYEEDDAIPAFKSVLSSIADAIRRPPLAEDAAFARRHREFVEYIRITSVGHQPDHGLGFNVPDEQYFAETRQYVQIPEFLMDPGFLRSVSRPETLGRAKSFLRRLNSKREPADQLQFFSFKSRHLGTPDSTHSFRRLLIVVPGDVDLGVPEKWVQFGLTDPGAGTRVRAVSVVAALEAADGTFNTYFKDYYRTFRKDGSIRIKGRYELGHGSDNCAHCHKSGVLPIFPVEGSVSPSEQPALEAVNRRFLTYGAARFDKYLDNGKFGPGISSASATDRAQRFGDGFHETVVGRAMTCATCHQQGRLGAFNFPMNKRVISSYIKGGQMPLNHPLEASERDELYEKLIQEYFATDDAHPGILKSWLLGRHRDGTASPASPRRGRQPGAE